METDENQMSDCFSALTEKEKLRLDTIKHPEKRCEFLTSRALRTELFGRREVHYSETGAPFIDNEGFISISHTHGLVGIARSADFNIGMDLEYIKEKAVSVSYRFVHESERQIFDTESAHDMSLLWSFKETLFKLAGKKGILWATDLIVEKQGDRFTGKILNHGKDCQYDLTLTNYKHYLVTCNTTDAILIS